MPSTGELREQWRHMATRYVGDVVERLGKAWLGSSGLEKILKYESSTVRIESKGQRRWDCRCRDVVFLPIGHDISQV